MALSSQERLDGCRLTGLVSILKTNQGSVQLASVDDAIQHVVLLGHQSQMAKIDVAYAYRNVPVHPQDRWLLGMQWEERVYIDTVLPFGLRSAPKIFCALSDAWSGSSTGDKWVMLLSTLMIS